MARAGAAGAGPVRSRARRVDRQRRAAVDRQRPAVLPGRPLVGRQRLHALLRRLPAARRPHGRPDRPPPPVRRRARRLRSRLARRRARHFIRHADRRARGAGYRRRDALPGGAVAGHRDLRRGRGAQQGARRLGRGRRLRRSGRRAARRRADRVRRLGVGPVRERADRHPRRPGGLAAAAREPQHRLAPLRHRRGGLGRCSSTRWSTPTTPAGPRARRSAWGPPHSR
jgi:hypothetical protein